MHSMSNRAAVRQRHSSRHARDGRWTCREEVMQVHPRAGLRRGHPPLERQVCIPTANNAHYVRFYVSLPGFLCASRHP